MNARHPHDEELWLEGQTSAKGIQQLEEILLISVEGNRTDEMEANYKRLRSDILGRPELKALAPDWLIGHRTLQSMWPFWKSFAGTWAERRGEIARAFTPLHEATEQAGPVRSSGWTGTGAFSSRVEAVRALAPLATAQIEVLIADLEAPNHNGAPKREEVTKALESLKELHRVLGLLIEDAEFASAESRLQSELLAQAVRYAKRSARALRDDPMPYAVAVGVYAIIGIFADEGIAGLISGMALNMRRNNG